VELAVENVILNGRSDNDAPLVYVGPGNTLEMLGSAELTGNTNTANPGGGVQVLEGTLCMADNAKIHHNGAAEGGGVHITGASARFIMSGGTISDNTADADGGGVYITGAIAQSTMSGGTISGNTAGNNGGGVYNNGPFTMQGGMISGNTAGNNGGGIYNSGNFTMSDGVMSGNTAGHGGGIYNNSSFTMSGSAMVAQDNDVYLPTGKTITVTGALTPDQTGSPAYSAKITPQAFPTTTLVKVLAGDSAVIAANKGKFAVTTDPPGKTWIINDEGNLVRGLAVECSLEDIEYIEFTNATGLYAERGNTISITASGADLSGAAWSVRMDGAVLSGTLSGSTYTITIPADTALGQKTITVFIDTGGALYSGSFQITVTQ
jgi:hypothetical protein